MTEICIPANGWKPYPHQRALWRALHPPRLPDGTRPAPKRRAVAVWHRRAGKDEVALHHAAVEAMVRIGTYWHMLPEYAQARKAIWNAVNPHTGRRRIDEAFPKEIRTRTNDQEMFIEFVNGSTWQVVGSDRYDSLVGTPPCGVVLSEWSLAHPLAWAYIAPILVENNGWAVFIYTPRGRNHGFSTYERARSDQRWFAEKLTVAQTGILSEEVIEEQRKEYQALFGADAGNALIEQEFYCAFDAPMPGAYYAHLLVTAEKEGRIGKVDYYPDLAVHCAWDLGISDATAVWAWQVWRDGTINILDYHEAAGITLDEHIKRINAKPWAKGEVVHWLPHDAKARELIAGRTRVETFQRAGCTIALVTDHKVDDGINAVRQIMPKVWFDAKNCEKGLDALRSYRSIFDAKKNVWATMPYHDWSSHGADAFRYLAMSAGTLGHGKKPGDKTRTVGRSTAVDGMTFDEIVRARTSGRAA